MNTLYSGGTKFMMEEGLTFAFSIIKKVLTFEIREN